MIYVMQVLTGKEEYVCKFLKDNLLSDAEDIYSPTYEREKKIHGQLVTVTGRLFPGYIFIRSEKVLDLYGRLEKAKNQGFLLTLTSLLRSEYYFVPMSVAEERSFEYLFSGRHHLDMSRGVITGEKLRIVSGPFAGKEKDIIHIDRHKRTATLRVHMLGRDMDVVVGLEVISKE